MNSVRQLQAVTPSDTVKLKFQTQIVYVGSAGDLKVIDAVGGTTLFTAMPIGWYPMQVVQILATGTTAADIVIGR